MKEISSGSPIPPHNEDSFEKVVHAGVEKAQAAKRFVDTELNKPMPEMSRRRFLASMGASAVIGAAVGKEYLSSEAILKTEKHETLMALSERFSGEQKAYTTLYDEMSFREILFIDDLGAPLSDPVTLEPIIILDTTGRKRTISPGELGSDGMLRGRINQEWLDQQRAHLKSKNPEIEVDVENSLPRQLNTIEIIRHAKEDLGSGVIIEKFTDIVRYYSSLSVPGDPDGLNHLEYVQKWFGYARAFSPTVEKELRFIVSGLAAQESQYNEKAISEAGAEGILQFMPSTRSGMGYSKEDFQQFSNQVEACGRYFEDAGRFFQRTLENIFHHIQEEFFAGSQEEFEKYFLVPLLVNSYNSGPPRVALVVKRFFERFPNKQSLEKYTGVKYENGFGHDLYTVMARAVAYAKDDLAVNGYKKHSSEYFSRAYALAKIIADF